MTILCTVCGKEFDRAPSRIRKHNYCCTACRDAGYRKLHKKPKVKKDRSHVNAARRAKPQFTMTRIRVTKLPCGVFPALMPEEGKIYPARKYPARRNLPDTVTIEMRGVQVVLRKNEYEELKEGEE